MLEEEKGIYNYTVHFISLHMDVHACSCSLAFIVVQYDDRAHEIDCHRMKFISDSSRYSIQ